MHFFWIGAQSIMGIGTYFIGVGDASASFLRLPVFINVPIGRYLHTKVLALAKAGT